MNNFCKYGRVSGLRFVLLGILLAALTGCPPNTQRYLLESMQKLKLGMSKSEADTIMTPYTKGTSWPYISALKIELTGSRRGVYAIDQRRNEELTLEGCDVYRHSELPKYDSDWGILCYTAGKLDWIDFSEDLQPEETYPRAISAAESAF
jgi:hypothetical protein